MPNCSHRFHANIILNFMDDVALALNRELIESEANVRHREDVLQVVSQIEGVRRFRDALRSTGHSVSYLEFEGGHECAAWKEALPTALRWALPNIPLPPLRAVQ